MPGQLPKARPPREDIGIVSVIPGRLRRQCDAVATARLRAQHAENLAEALAVLRVASPRPVLLAPSLIARDGSGSVRQLVARPSDLERLAGRR